ncbi:hypothetical protein [Nitrosomonas mobilis]|uniref:LACTB2 winged helix domain-containing protein n=1 Tax=Nitrosomonas mobilis TaxID=51642 RepID=A0A1G5SGN5_9PROT|nr:hypothetical protein NSMM_490046 [Nitrosomonas mobilis]
MEVAGPASSGEITKATYDGAPPAIHPLAQSPLLAHLFKLEQEHVVAQTEVQWRLL